MKIQLHDSCLWCSAVLFGPPASKEAESPSQCTVSVSASENMVQLNAIDWGSVVQLSNIVCGTETIV